MQSKGIEYMNDERVFRQENRDEIRRQGSSDSFCNVVGLKLVWY